MAPWLVTRRTAEQGVALGRPIKAGSWQARRVGVGAKEQGHHHAVACIPAVRARCTPTPAAGHARVASVGCCVCKGGWMAGYDPTGDQATETELGEMTRPVASAFWRPRRPQARMPHRLMTPRPTRSRGPASR
eukprot:scaffold126049_cov65-Phaeocystis_antarctica.AAC.1